MSDEDIERYEAEIELQLYREYKDVAGWKWPHLIENAAKGRPEKQTLSFARIEVNPAIDDARFRMPAAKASDPPRQ